MAHMKIHGDDGRRKPAASGRLPTTDEDVRSEPCFRNSHGPDNQIKAADEPTIYTGPVYPADRPTWVTEPNVTRGDMHTVVVDWTRYLAMMFRHSMRR
ncbi:MAG: hypothetical protein R3C99_06410 [Pirellulaceae bacterium]